MKQLLKKLKTNKKLVTAIFMITLLLGLITSVSFAAYNFINDAEDNAMNLGQVSMTYTEPSNEVVLKDALPKKDDLGKNQEEYFEFSVMSHATTNADDDNGIVIPYEISISKAAVDASKKQLEDNQVKVYLTRLDGASEIDVLNPTLVSNLKQSDYDNNGYKVYDGSDAHSNNNDSITTKYRIRFWLDENVDVSNWATTNEYEYKFKVNVNAKANKETNSSITLSKAIKSMYTLDNGTAKVEDGYYYLTGMEESDDLTTEQELLAQFGGMANVYYYRRTDGTFDANQLEADIKNYLVNENGLPENEYTTMTSPFGGYLNAVIGMVFGVVTEDMQFAEGKTIDDIPTLDEAMADETIKLNIIDFMADITYEIAAYTPSTFQKIYSTGASINEELLNENLELGGIAAGASDMITTINAKFGNISNYAIAQAYEMIDYDTMDFIEGKTVDDLPTLDELFLNYTGPILIANNYIRLNNLLYKVIGINSDNSVRLVLAIDMFTVSNKNYNITDSGYSKYLGIGEENEKKSPFIKLLKGTTLEEIIQKKDYKYFIDNEAQYINSYVSLLTQEEIEESNDDVSDSFMLNGYSYYHYNAYVPIANYISKTDVNQYNKYKTVSESGNFNENYAFDDNSSYQFFYIRPVITIEDVKVEGVGSRGNPYYIKNEKIISDLDVANSIHYTIKYLFENNMRYVGSYVGSNAKWNFNDSSPSYLKSNIEHFKEYNLDLENSNMNYTNSNIFLGLNINGVCYYTDSYGKIYKSEDTGNCVAPEESANIVQKINGEETTTYSTYLNYEEVTLSVDNVEEGVTYQWQYSDSSSSYATWHDLKDGKNVFEEENKMTVSGANTKELKILPIASDNSNMYFRCVINNVYTNKMTISLKDKEITNQVWIPAEDNSGYSYVYYGDTITFEADVLGVSEYWTEKTTDNGSVEYGHTEITQLGQQHIKIEVKIDESFIDGNLKFYFKGAEDKSDIYSTPTTILRISGPEIVTQPKSIEVGTGYTGTLKVNARGALYYQWQQKIGEEWVNLEDIENKISGTTTDKLKITTTSEMEIVTSYRCLLKTKEELYTNEATITLIEADEDWQYEKITDADGIPTGELNVVKYIGSYEESNSVKVVENYFNMAKAEEIGYDIDDYWVHYVYFGEGGIISPEVYYRVAIEEYGMKPSEIDVTVIRRVLKDEMSYYGKTKKSKDIDWDKYYNGYNNAYEITLPRSYKGQSVIGATKMLFNHDLVNRKIETPEYWNYNAIEDYLNGNEVNLNAVRIKDIIIPEGYKYIGNDIPTEDFAESPMKLDMIDYNVVKDNSVLLGLSNLENIEFASTIELIGTGAIFSCGSTYTEVELPKNLQKLNAYFKFGLSKIKFQEGATIKELTKDNFIMEFTTIALEVPASVEKIGPGIHHYYENSEGQEVNNFKELTFVDTDDNPSQLTIIEDGADLCKNCETLKLPRNLKTIGVGAFFNNSYLTELEIPASVEEIRAGAFYKAPLTKLTLHEGLKEIKSSYEQDGETGEIAAFGSSVLKELSVPSSVTKVESKAFTNAQFENLKIYGKTTLADFTDYVDGTFTMAEGYTPQFVQGTLE